MSRLCGPTLLAIFAFAAGCNDGGIHAINTGPVAAITSHVDGDTVLVGAEVSLRGAVSDVDDPADELSALWFVGSAELCGATPPADDGSTTCATTFVEPGPVTVLLEGKDDNNATDSVSVDLIVATGQAPAITILFPEEGSIHGSADLVTISAQIADTDGTVTEVVLEWTDDPDGTLTEMAANPAIDGTVEGTQIFTVGAHTLTLTATDITGQISTDSVSFTVADETCDGLDNDGDGVVDNGFDVDGDGVTVCGPDGLTGTPDDDCDDNDNTIYPGAPDPYGDGIDQNCDGFDGIDADGDGWLAPGDGVDTANEDCDDDDDTVHPWAGDTHGDGVDSDCDGLDCNAVMCEDSSCNAFVTDVFYLLGCDATDPDSPSSSQGTPTRPTWDAAKTECEAAGYDSLASIHSAEENALLLTLSPSGGMWTGYNDISSEGTWVWSDGTVGGYTNWKAETSEPNDTVGNENCLEFIGPASSYPGEWNDAPCSTIYRQWSCIWRDD